MNKVETPMTNTTLGNTNKDGVILKTQHGFNYYNGISDDTLKTVTRPRDGATVKTSKVYEPVVVANHKVTVVVYPDGRVEITPNVQ